MIELTYADLALLLLLFFIGGQLSIPLYRAGLRLRRAHKAARRAAAPIRKRRRRRTNRPTTPNGN